MDIFCSNSNHTLNNTVSCSIMAITTNKDDTIDVYDEDGTLTTYSIAANESRAYLGTFDTRMNVTNYQTVSSTGNYILPNLEFKFNTFITGFEFFAANPGTITIKVSLNLKRLI